MSRTHFFLSCLLMSVWESPFSFSLQNRENDHRWYLNWWYSWCCILCVNQTGMAMGCSDTFLNIISQCISEDDSGWDCIWICRLNRLPFSMCVCSGCGVERMLIQSFEGPKKNKKSEQRSIRFLCLHAFELVHWSSPAFRLRFRLELYHCRS